MKNIVNIILFSLIATATGGCSDDSISELPINFKFRLLDETGNPSTTFKEGENFVFSFLIINKSNQVLNLRQSIDQSDFFKVYRLNPEGNSAKIAVGKPYINMFCEYKLGIQIAQKDTLKFEIPWNPNPWEQGNIYYNAIFCKINENSPLPVGIYTTGFSSAFEFFSKDESYRTDNENFEIDFKVVK